MADYVILLGAGASTPYGIPTFAEFRSTAEKIVGKEELISGLLVIWKRFYDDIDLEEFYSLLENQLISETEIKLIGSKVLTPEEQTLLIGTEYLSGTGLNFKYAMRQVERLIPNILLASADPARSNAYDDVVARILEAEKKVTWSPFKQYYGTDVISFNWDTLFETSVAKAGLPVRYPGDPYPGKPYFAISKPHGSINIEACLNPGCKVGVVRRDEISERYGKGAWVPAQCDSCKELRELVLLAPTFVKHPHPALLGWHAYTLRQAYSAMAHCRKMLIVGYRFPMTDYQFYLTFRNAVRLNKRLTTILVVNKQKPPNEEAIFRLHFEELLHGTGKEKLLEFDFSGVEKWAQEPFG